MSDLRIESDGTITRVFLGDEDISAAVRAVSWDHGAPNQPPKATVEFQLVELIAYGGEVQWAGLEHVPWEALQAEIERRKEGNR